MGKRVPFGISHKYDWATEFETIQDAIASCDCIPEEGEDFAAGVQERLRDIGETIEKTRRVTDGQHRAVENMIRGIEAWL